MARIYPDSKTFVDLHLRNDEQKTLDLFDELLNNTNDEPSKEDIKQFVEENFDEGKELEMWKPDDFTDDPKFLKGIKDERLRKFGKNVHNIWPNLGRQVKQEVIDHPERYSLIPLTNGFIIPGGRFKEIYYWDTYWIIEGLLISDMKETAKGMIENLIELLKILGHIPNGSRWYYEERSQPPLLTAMVALYLRKTKDISFLRKNIDALEDEVEYWFNTQTVTFQKNKQMYTLLRYNAPSAGPRPESYHEDFINGQLFEDKERREEFYVDIKSAAESGWDFSSRWFIDENGGNTGNLTNIHTKSIIPVDLNAIFVNAMQNMAYFRGILGNPKKAAVWAIKAKVWRNSINDVLWDEEDGIWHDYDISNGKHRKYFYPTNLAPLWMGVVDKSLVRKYAPKIMDYLKETSGLDFPGGVPSSLDRTGEQWDFPNAWPPLVSIVVNALEAMKLTEAKEAAFHVAQTWVRSNMLGFEDTNQMFEKYDAEKPGQVGGGGEYTVQEGFGWSNGVILEFLTKYGRSLTSTDGNKTE